MSPAPQSLFKKVNPQQIVQPGFASFSPDGRWLLIIAPTLASAAGGESAKLIFLICDREDRKATVPIRKLCRQAGLEVELPAFEGDASQVRQANQQLLATCDGVLLFYGAGDEAWKRTLDNELKKMPGYRGGTPLLARYTYLAEPKTSEKQDLIDMEEPGLIN